MLAKMLSHSSSLPTRKSSQRDMTDGNPAPKRLAKRGTARALEAGLRLLGPHYDPFLFAVRHTPPVAFERLGRWRAEAAAWRAARDVPAYRRHLASGIELAAVGRLGLPTTDKENYVQRYPVAERCRGGVLPERGVMIDESSGSSGTPYNWVRASHERRATHVFISHFARYCFGDAPWVTINAFSMGAWATGINMSAALERNGLLKNTGPNIDKILGTLEFVGPARRYLICGYPPFLKHLVDEARRQGFPLKSYRLMGLVGGEGMSEGLRDYLMPYFEPLYSGYGATDIEIGLAGETALSVAIRRLARDDARVRELLFGDDPRLPMLFQYNPLQHHVTTNTSGELVFTINRPGVLAPRIAYNVHDEGGVLRFDEMTARLQAAGIDIRALTPGGPAPVRFPFLLVFGRTDSTVSVMGANIYPEDLESALYAAPELAARTNSFCLSALDQPDGTIRPCFAFEIHGEPDEALRQAFSDRITAGIAALNADFREALGEHAEALTPVVELHPLGSGPYAADAGRIKQRRIIRTSA